MRFNVLTDRWIPLRDGDRVRHASFPELLSGERDAAELAHPRDDFRVFALMLLSALTQALFAAKNLDELRRRIAEPLPRGEIDKAVAAVASDFELLGDSPFMQDAEAKGDDNDTSLLLLDVSQTSGIPLKRPAEPHDGVCPRCAVLTAYGIQAFAAAGGRGYSPGVRGSPPATTMVWQPSVRATVWANTLASDSVKASYPQDPARPWSGDRQQLPGDRIGLVQGLFWRPRAFRFVESTEGVCCTCGATGPRVAAQGFAPRSKVEGFFAHPHTPSLLVKDERRSLHFRTDRPTWTALADLLSVVRSTNAGKTDRETLAAPVVVQWIEGLRNRDVSLMVFSYETESGQAKLLGRFSEAWTVSMAIRDLDLLNDLQGLVTRAQETVSSLRYALTRAHSDRPKDKGGYWPDDAAAAFWQATEPAFWDAKAAFERDEDRSVEFARTLRATAIALFDQHTEPSVFDNTHQRLVARARAGLLRSLAQSLTTKKEESHAVA